MGMMRETAAGYVLLRVMYHVARLLAVLSITMDGEEGGGGGIVVAE